MKKEFKHINIDRKNFNRNDLYEVYVEARRDGQIKLRDSDFNFPMRFSEWVTLMLTRIKGCTICTLIEGNRVLTHGYAFCSINDNFSKQVGRDISYDRAVAQLCSIYCEI